MFCKFFVVNCYRIPKIFFSFRDLCFIIISKVLQNSKISAAKHQNDILQMFYGEIPAQVNRRLPRPLHPRVVEIEDVFFTSQNNYNKWLRVWKMIVSERNPHNKDLFEFARATKESFTQLIKRELKELKNIKVRLEMKVKFKKEQEEEQTLYIEHYFEKMSHRFLTQTTTKTR